jgi:cytochrome b subunit of formate dehydrogenase
LVSSVFFISFQYFLPYFPMIFTIFSGIFHIISQFSSIFFIPFHYFFPYFPYHFTIRLTFLPYFPYHFNI